MAIKMIIDSFHARLINCRQSQVFDNPIELSFKSEFIPPAAQLIDQTMDL